MANEMFSLYKTIPNLFWFVDVANMGSINEVASSSSKHLN